MGLSKYSVGINIQCLMGVVLSLGMVGVCMGQNCPRNYVDAHNKYRAEVGVEPLAWNHTVAAYAKRYARWRSKDCGMVHSKGPYGECLATGWGTRFTGVEAVKLWAKEKENYDYETNTCTKGMCGHYTQVVWHSSVQLGCARMKCRNTDYRFITCNYYPPGNYIGQRPY